MSLIIKTTLISVFIVSLLSTATGQQNPVLAEGVKPHKGIDNIYREFSLGYETLDAAMVGGLYAKDASYLPPTSETVTGRTAILRNFEDFFSNIKERGQSMTISFQIEKRRATDKLGYDIGVYEIVFTKDGAAVGNSKGRFVVVTTKDNDGKWRFDVDAYTALEESE